MADVELTRATDRQIWEFAGEHGYAIVSKDADFRQLAFMHGPPPKVIWLRVGNVSTTEILDLIQRLLDMAVQGAIVWVRLRGPRGYSTFR